MERGGGEREGYSTMNRTFASASTDADLHGERDLASNGRTGAGGSLVVVRLHTPQRGWSPKEVHPPTQSRLDRHTIARHLLIALHT